MGYLHVIKKVTSSLVWLGSTLFQGLTGQTTLNYARIKIWSQLTLVGKRFIDGVNWKSYHEHYSEELKMIQKTNTLIIDKENFSLIDGKISMKSPDLKPLLPSHRLLYETILELNPIEVLEIGCGGGDHLANLKTLIPGVKIDGIELLTDQLDTLNSRHPGHDFNLSLADITSSKFVYPKTDLVFTHAVLMHITEKEERFKFALNNVLNTASRFVVLMENWTQHNFLAGVQEFLSNNPEWEVFFKASNYGEEARIVILSKIELFNNSPLSDYSDLSPDYRLRPH
jgi:SAM-dependent methyltransferase